MDRNQFPRRMCGFALCLLGIEVGLWQSNCGPQVNPEATSTVVPLENSDPIEMSAVQ